METSISPSHHELPDGYTLEVFNGQVLLKDDVMVNKLQSAWAASYRQSTEGSQSSDQKYADTQQAADVRVRQIKKELGQKDSLVAVAIHQDEIVGFFWGLSMKGLHNIDSAKAKQVKTMVEQSVATGLPENLDRTAYLSMLGVVNQSADGTTHTGKKLGQILTDALTQGFSRRGFEHAVARTINPLAWEKTYKPLGFTLYGDTYDKQAGAIRYFFGKRI